MELTSKIQYASYLISILHILFLNSMITIILVSHTLYTAVWLKIVIFISLVLIIIQHIILGSCFLTIFERKYTDNQESPYYDFIEKFLSLFGITLKEYYTHVLVIEITATLCLGLEVLSILCS